jgi:hypothetical protein
MSIITKKRKSIKENCEKIGLKISTFKWTRSYLGFAHNSNFMLTDIAANTMRKAVKKNSYSK